MYTKDEISALWENECLLTEDNLLQRLGEIAWMQNRYFKILMSHQEALEVLKVAHKSLYKDLREYFLHGLVEKPSKEDILKYPKGGVSRSEVDIYINSHATFKASILKLADTKRTISYVEQILQSLEERNSIAKEINNRKNFLAEGDP
jgi:hypothetical protein